MPHQPGYIVNLEFVHHLLAMFLNCFDAKPQFSGDLFVGKAFSYQLKNFRFARSTARF